MRITTRAALAATLAVGVAGSGTTLALAAPKGAPAMPTKVYVCKYVGKPGVDERLKAGKNPIAVSVNSIKEYKDGRLVKIGDHFADGQDMSLVVGFVGDKRPEPKCPPTMPTDKPSDKPTEPTKPTTPAKPTEPTKPTTPAKPTEPTRGVDAKTGVEEELPVLPIAALTGLAGAALSGLALKRRR